MRSSNSIRPLATRILSALIAWTMTFGPVTVAYGSPTPLADVPIAAKVSAKPNIIYTLDDSGSMQYNYLPDYVVNASATLPLTNITRVAPVGVNPYSVATATATAANIALLSVGDFVAITGVATPEYGGFFEIKSIPSPTTFTYWIYPPLPALLTSSVAAGYANRQIVKSAAYCRSGNNTATCPQQAVNIASAGTAVGLTSITRVGPITVGGPVTATATGTAANLATLNTGDTVLIQTAACCAPAATWPAPGTSSDPYYGVFVITKLSATQFTYTINAIASPPVALATPLAAGGGRQFVIQGGSTFAPPPLHAADFNRLAYNPAVTYTPPKKADGTPLTNTGTDANGNYGYNALKWATPSVDRDPFAKYETNTQSAPETGASPAVTPMWAVTVKDDLSIRVGVPLYCNTDWPLLVNDANWSAGPNGAIAADAGDSNGQYQATKGAWCRINGTKYDASALSGAPATAVAGVEMGYNYPWQSSSGAKNAQYFYQLLGTKTIWCDKTSPNWPRNGVIIGCTLGGTPTCGGVACPINQQSCTQNAKTCNPTVGLRNYNPAACANPPTAVYCAPNVGGSDANSPGTGAIPECLACTCKADFQPAGGKCSSSGAACTAPYGSLRPVGDAECPGVAAAPNGCSVGNPIFSGPAANANCTSFLWDPVAGVYTATTLLVDAGAPAAGGANTTGALGTTCRHNNYSYAVGGLAGLFKYAAASPAYPGEGAGTGLFNTAVTGGCPTVGTTVQIPRHYYVIDSVQFCDSRTVTADVQWKGFGIGNCQAKNDLAKFKEVQYGAFTRVDLFPTNSVAFPGNSNFAASATPYPKGAPANPSNRVWLAGASPGPDNSESINYANWYAYYSTRLNAAKTTSSLAFSYLTNVAPDPIQYRVGFHNLGEEPATFGGAGTPIIWANVNDWDLTQRYSWYGKLFGVAVSTYKTPTLDAMLRIGNLVETGLTTGLPAAINPLPAGTTDPFSTKPDGTIVSCQSNFHILFTDGKTNQVTPTTTAGEQDATLPTTLSLAAGQPIQPVPPDNVLGTLAPLAATNAVWPRPFVQGTPAVANTLSDVAAYYWVRDLRPTDKNDVPSTSSKIVNVCADPVNFPCPPAALVPFSNDSDPTKDVAWWQHVNFSAISFGAEGTLDAGNQTATFRALKAGTLNWPDLTQPNNPINPKGAGAGAVAVDDLWHATAMARGSFVFAKNPLEVSYGIANILAGIQNQRKSRSGAAFGGQVLNAVNDVIFEPTIEPGWAGDLLKVQIDPTTGAEVKTWWQASTTLADQIDPTKTGSTEPWMDPAHRRIVTLTGSSGPGTPFQFANLTNAQLLSLAPDATQQQKIISYLRGGNTWTDPMTSTVYTIEGTSIGQFRKRFGVLGDLSNAQPVLVFNPSRPYYDSTDPGYSAFVTANASRLVRVVAPANDGMVHVFNAGPMPTKLSPIITAGGGDEVFAFIPKALFKGVAGTVAEDATGIQALTYQDGGVPIYHHHMYVDSSPRSADIFDGTNWRSIVVGGLGKGGNSYYALDLTDSSAADETVAANKVMWEWSDPEVKYSYGRPVIVKVRDSAYPNGRWVVIVTGGYDNASGKGKVFFLDAVTGTLLSTVTTSAGSPPGALPATIPSTASGLAQIHAFVQHQTNQVAEQLYGGDLLGNVWRIDVSAPDSYKTAGAVLFAQLTDPSGAAQPVTTAPQIEIDISNGVDRYVFIGTGRLIDTTDLTNPDPPQTQTMYAIRDGTLAQFQTVGLPIQPRVTMTSVDVPSGGVAPISTGAPNGWYHDLPNIVGTDSERMVVDPESDVNVAAYVGTMIQSDPCLISLPAKLYARDYTTGESLVADASGNPIAFADFPLGLVAIATVGLIQPDGSQVVGIIGMQEVPGARPVQILNKFTGVGTRLSWKLLSGQ